MPQLCRAVAQGGGARVRGHNGCIADAQRMQRPSACAHVLLRGLSAVPRGAGVDKYRSRYQACGTYVAVLYGFAVSTGIRVT